MNSIEEFRAVLTMGVLLVFAVFLFILYKLLWVYTKITVAVLIFLVIIIVIMVLLFFFGEKIGLHNIRGDMSKKFAEVFDLHIYIGKPGTLRIYTKISRSNEYFMEKVLKNATGLQSNDPMVEWVNIVYSYNKLIKGKMVFIQDLTIQNFPLVIKFLNLPYYKYLKFFDLLDARFFVFTELTKKYGTTTPEIYSSLVQNPNLLTNVMDSEIFKIHAHYFTESSKILKNPILIDTTFPPRDFSKSFVLWLVEDSTAIHILDKFSRVLDSTYPFATFFELAKKSVQAAIFHIQIQSKVVFTPDFLHFLELCSSFLTSTTSIFMHFLFFVLCLFKWKLVFSLPTTLPKIYIYLLKKINGV